MTESASPPPFATTVRTRFPFDQGRPPLRVVVKVGSNVLSHPGPGLNRARLQSIAAQIAEVTTRGSQVLLVSSGAVAAGLGALGMAARPTHLPQLQALAAVGQSRLMATWEAAFHPHGLATAQILLTREDLEDRRRYLNAGHTLEALLATQGVVPIINENDTVATEELTFGDNDMLSAIIAAKTNAEMLVILTDLDGLYTANPQNDPQAQLIEQVDRITPELLAVAGGSISGVGRGGMASKVEAARHANRFGLHAVVANGRCDTILGDIFAGEFRGTHFLPSGSRALRARGRARTHWIAQRRPKGRIVVDDGARAALVEGGRSLLPVGITAVEGRFTRGDVVTVLGPGGEEIARGVTNYSREILDRIKGCRVHDLPEALGKRPEYDEAIHRNNLHVTALERSGRVPGPDDGVPV
ncbi:MAG: glutamate 5-kinase [Sumerlaeia bacterium]